ncbi:hypothetical protein [Coleofasciculus sp. E2-BRE-01]|uniref:hypothetical protein n=1 Tax=Coleofasciculus sp. E2-BRE-01 TaxID=3069524 RepID=UPI004062DA5B
MTRLDLDGSPIVASVEVVSFLSQFGQVADGKETLFSSNLSCYAFKLGMGNNQDARITTIFPLLILRFKCRTTYSTFDKR